jgi:putative glutamine amidotransferase
MSRRPLIGVTKGEDGDLTGFACAWISLWLSGARPVAITAGAPREALEIDGLLLGGGSDVHPSLFETLPKEGYAYDRPREAVELDWLRRAAAADLPTLGVCRGAQLMNVAEGGALHMDLADTFRETHYPESWLEQLYFRKSIRVEPDTRLAAILGRAELKVSSIHKQAVGRVGEGLVVSARERNGAIQAVENPRRRFWLGVQFHPEFLFYREPFRRLFRAFVAEAALYRQRRGSRAVGAQAAGCGAGAEGPRPRRG